METRKITIVSTRTQKKSVIETNAATLRELKAALDVAEIDYTDMDFYEGVSKTQLLSDDAYLPHDVPYKGTTTNELVFMLTNMNKKIASGISRSEVYAVIKGNNLVDVVKNTFGKNFTQVSTENLLQVIADNSTVVPDNASEEAAYSCDCEKRFAEIERRLQRIEGMLADRYEAASSSSYSNYEIEEMFDFIERD